MNENIFDLIKNSSLSRIKKKFNDKFRKEKDEQGAYLTFYAAMNGKLEIFKYLLLKKVPLRGSDVDKNTILFYAIKGNNPEIIKIILEKNINVNQLNKTGASAICYLNKNTKSEILDILIKNGLEINKKYKIIQKNSQKSYWIERNLIFYAIKNQNIKILKFLISKRINFSTFLLNELTKTKKKIFYYILRYGTLEIIKLFIKNKINIKLSKNNIKEIVEYYIKDGEYLKLKFILIELNYEIFEFKFGKNNRYNALNYGIKYKNIKIVKLLMKLGAEINFIDEYYYKPISYSIKYGDLDIFKLLEDTDINYIIYPSETILEIASRNNYKIIVKYLLYNNKVNFKFEFDYENKLDFGVDISPVITRLNFLNPLIKYDFSISYIKRAIKMGVKIKEDHVLLAIHRKKINILVYLIKTAKNINLLIENEINTESILSFIIKKFKTSDILEVLENAVKNNYLIYYVLRYEYLEIFKLLKLNSKELIPSFNLENKLLIPIENNIKIKNYFILDFGNRLFKIYYDKVLNHLVFIDNHGITYKNLPKIAKKDDYNKANRAILFYNKYRKFLIF